MYDALVCKFAMLKAVTVQMFKPVRVVATILFLGSIVLVIIGAFVLNSDILCISMSHLSTSFRPLHLTSPLYSS